MQDGFTAMKSVYDSLKELFFAPGNLLINILLEHYPHWADSLGISEDSYYGVASGVLSFCIWIGLVFLLTKLLDWATPDRLE